MTVCIVDTSILCNVLRMPGRDQHYEQAIAELEVHIEQRHRLLLPVTAILEAGNLIAQSGDGRQRRAVAERFIQQVRQAIEGQAPWTPTPAFELDRVLKYLDGFAEHAMRGVGFGDMAITYEFERQCQLNPGRRVFVWSYDDHLRAYDRPPTLSRSERE